MPTPPLSEEKMQRAVDALKEHGSQNKAAEALGISRATLQHQLRKAALAGTAPGHFNSGVAPGYRMGKVTVQRDAGGNVVQTWERQSPDAAAMWSGMEAVREAFMADIPRDQPVARPARGFNPDLLNQYIVTDSHFGMLSWAEETGADYDLKIAGELLLDWFATAIAASECAHTAILAQLGDLVHYDSMVPVTPIHRHVLDADSRFPKVVKVASRVMRRVCRILLAKYQEVRVVIAPGNHDTASAVWIRDGLAAQFEDEPRFVMNERPGPYFVEEWGRTALFYHHGDKRGIANIDATLAGKFREIYGKSQQAYAHIGHFHSDEGRKTGLMYVERHETLAPPDAHAAWGGWLSGRSGKVITYHKEDGEWSRLTRRPARVAGAFKAANDNFPQAERKVA